MAWLKIESSVARNRKFVKAGPGPSWLWVCGLAYCQEGLTDGFIPSEAIEYLGVRSARNLARHLVSAGLWDEAEGGWQVHDYLAHNRSAADVQEIRSARAAGGSKGGRPRNLPHTSKVSRKETLPETLPQTLHETFPIAGSVDASVAAVDVSRQPRFDVWFQELRLAYPQQATADGPMVQQAFLSIFERDTRDPSVVFAELRGAIENQKQGAQWKAGKVPKLLNWLKEGLYTQRHETAQTHDSRLPVWARR